MGNVPVFSVRLSKVAVEVLVDPNVDIDTPIPI